MRVERDENGNRMRPRTRAQTLKEFQNGVQVTMVNEALGLRLRLQKQEDGKVEAKIAGLGSEEDTRKRIEEAGGSEKLVKTALDYLHTQEYALARKRRRRP